MPVIQEPQSRSKPSVRAESAASGRVLVGRHPILDRHRQVFGYELLFQPANQLEAAETTPEEAAARVIAETVLSFGLDKLTHGRRAFVKIPPAFLGHDVIRLLPPAQVVLEVPFDSGLDASAVEACSALVREGYSLALDNFAATIEHPALLSLASFVKFDFLASSTRETALCLAARKERPAMGMIADQVEAVEVFEEACREGFSHFQGFFFGQPAALQARTIPAGQVGHLRLLRALNDPALGVNEIEELVKRDASLCYRILRVVNSAAFAQTREVSSIRQALLLVGRDTVRRWASLWVLAELGAGAHAEVVTMASIRARFCELLATRAGDQDGAGEGFLLGLCSLLEVIVGRPLASILEELPLSASVEAALAGHDNTGRRLLDCVIAYERGDWNLCLSLADLVGIDRAWLRQAYFESLRWANELRSPAPQTKH